MKYIAFLILIITMSFISGCSKENGTLTSTQSDTYEVTEDKNKMGENNVEATQSSTEKVITWATNPNYPPYDWSSDGENYEGAAVDLLALIIPKEYTLKAVMVPWKRAQEMAQNGEIDLLVNLRITPEREEWLVFSENPTFYNPISVFMEEKSKIPFDTWDELKNLRGGVALGDTFGNGFDEYITSNLTVETAPSMGENFSKLDNERIDYYVTGYYMGMAYLNSAKLSDTIVALTPPISNNSIHLGFSKLSKHLDLMPEINEKLARLEEAGTLKQILQDNLSKFTTMPLENFPQ